MTRTFKIFVLFISIMTASVAFAQEPADTVASLSGITVETSVDKAEVYIGDLVNYKITVTYDSTIELLPPPLGANLGAFDVKDYETDITTKLPDGRLQSVSHFVLSTFTTGDYTVPPVPIAFQMPDGSRKVILSETVPIKVKSLLLNDSDSTDIRPLKAQYEFQRDYFWYYVWGGVGLLFLLGLLYFFWWRRKHRVDAEQIDLRPAWEIAFEKLAQLEQKNLPEESKFKEYYLELTDIIRAYLERMYARNIMDMTTEELFSNYEDIGLNDDNRDQLKEFFDHADLVKFAKFAPNTQQCEIDFKYVHTLIEQIRVEFKKKAEEEYQLQTRVPAETGSSTEEETDSESDTNQPPPPPPAATVGGDGR